MTTLINASTSSGLLVSTDNSGEIALQSNGTTKATINSNGLSSPGHIVQVAQQVMSQASVTISSTSYVDTGLNVSITTKSLNSKFLVRLSGGGWYDNGNAYHAMYITFQRNFNSGSYDWATNSYNGSYGLTRMSGDGNGWNIGPYSAEVIDVPNQPVGTVINYKVVAKVNSASSQFQSDDRGLPVITVMEIAQ